MSDSPARAAHSPASTGRSPSHRLVWGLVLSLLTVLGFCLYAVFEIATLRDRQVAESERNRRDSLQLLRIQNNLSTLATTLRDMVDRTEPYPMAAWRHTFDRLRVDLTQALEQERTLAPARPAGQQAQLTESADRFWQAVDRAFTLAGSNDERGAADIVRQSALPRHAELSGLVSQLLIRNTQVEDDAVAAARDVYTRVIRQIYALMVVLLLAVGLIGLLNILATRRAFEDLRVVTRQMRALTWRMLRMQEQLQARVARELHDEFGQILTALTMLIGRAKGRFMAESERQAASRAESATGTAGLPVRTVTIGNGPGGRFIFAATRLRIVPAMAAMSGKAEPVAGESSSVVSAEASSSVPDTLGTTPAEQENWPSQSFQATFIRDLEEVEALTKDTLDRIRNDARLLHPTVLDDFGLEEALCSHTLDFGKRHHIVAWFSRNKPIGKISSDVRANVFRIVQEALTNIGRHSDAREFWVRVKRRNSRLHVEVEDFGRGLPHWGTGELAARRSPAETGLGMIGMRERAEALGGSFEIRRGERGGVLIHVELSVDARMPDDSLYLLAEGATNVPTPDAPDDGGEG